MESLSAMRDTYYIEEGRLVPYENGGLGLVKRTPGVEFDGRCFYGRGDWTSIKTFIILDKELPFEDPRISDFLTTGIYDVVENHKIIDQFEKKPKEGSTTNLNITVEPLHMWVSNFGR